MTQYQPSKYCWQWTLGILLLPFATAPALAATEMPLFHRVLSLRSLNHRRPMR
jgi:hypothetical protein